MNLTKTFLLLIMVSSCFALDKLTVDGHHLVDQNGKPVYLLGDTAWTMPEHASREDIIYYLNKRQSQGFNFIQIVAVRDLDPSETLSTIYTRNMNPSNRYGHKPFETQAGSTRADPGRPIETAGGTPTNPNDYWDHIDYILQEAEKRDMYVGLLPTWGKYYIRDDSKNLFNEQNAYDYGYFLGDRYKGYEHIIWILGGDVPPEHAKSWDVVPVYRKMAEGIAKGVTGLDADYRNSNVWDQLLITYHGNPSAKDLITGEDAWLRLNMVYDGDPDLFANTKANYENTPVRPIYQGESFYEGWTFAGLKSSRLVRRQMYHSFFAGAIGHVYGTANTAEDVQDQVFRFKNDGAWKNRLELPGATAMTNLKVLLDSQDWEDWVPAHDLLSSGDEVKAAVRAGDNILVYFPFVSPETIDLSHIQNKQNVKATWFNPMTGNTKEGGVYEKKSKEFTPPSTWEDSVLILEGTDDALDDLTTKIPGYKTVNGEVVMAAEAYSYKGGNDGSWDLKTTRTGYLGDGYMESSLDVPSGINHLRFSENHPNLNYIIDFEESGRYYIHLRTLADDTTENGFFATLDGKEVYYGGANPEDSSLVAFYLFVKGRKSWWWYTDGGGAETQALRPNGLKVYFDVATPGKHTFAIYRRDTGSRIDHIWLTKETKAPQDIATIGLPDPSEFIAGASGPICGQNGCESGETCSSCPEDCGECAKDDVIEPSDDAYLEAGARKNDEYLKLRVRTAPIREIYMKFPAVDAQEAILTLTCVNDPGSGLIKVYKGSHNSWTQTSLTDSNKPEKNDLISQMDTTYEVGNEYSFDVTSAFDGGETTLILEMEDGNDVSFSSSEGDHAPRLEVNRHCTTISEVHGLIQDWLKNDIDILMVLQAINSWKGC